MSKFISVVKFKVITEEENNFIEAMKKYNLPDGLIYRKLIKTGEYSYCSIIEWVNEEALENARPQMIAFLDTTILPLYLSIFKIKRSIGLLSNSFVEL